VELLEKRFGAFNGVFLPTFLTVIGVIFYLRFGWVVGNAGIMGAVSIVILAHVITISTALSMSSITTNMDVKGGGAYYLISRSLGLEIGGSIGIPLYLSQVISVSLYILGFVESVKMIYPNINDKMTALAVTIVIGIISAIGADLAVKAQYLVFSVILLSLGSIAVSGNYDIVPVSIGSFSESGNYWKTFAVFFPAVTGILAGVSMSGDLKNPRRDIPKGTLAAIGVTFTIYLIQIFWLGMNVSVEELLNNKLIIITKTKFPIFIIGGIWAATLSSALGSMIAAPRTMMALSKDSVFPKIFGRGSGKTNEPRIASLVSFVIATIFIMKVNLDFVAPVITMFFLNTYGAINAVAALETLVGNPSYRPTFKTPWLISLIGAFGSYRVMFLINSNATIICLAFTLCIYLYLSKKNISRTWGDLRDGVLVSVIRLCLLQLRFNQKKAKNWKPDILVFSGSPESRSELVYLAQKFSKGRGIITLVHYIFGRIEDKKGDVEDAKHALEKYIQENNLNAFSEVVVGSDMISTMEKTVQTNGIGLLKPNTILMGIPKSHERVAPLIRFIRKITYLNKNLILLVENDKNSFGEKRTIDIWWRGLENNGDFMLNLAHLISLNDDWKKSKIRLLSIVRDSVESKEREKLVEEMLDYMRIDAEVKVVSKDKGKSISEMISENSSETDLVFMGLAVPDENKEEEYYGRVINMTKNLKTVLLVKGKLT
jgi:amino acid transporter